MTQHINVTIEDGKYASNVKYIMSQVSNTDDAYYLIKALLNPDTRKCVLNPGFLDSAAAFIVAQNLFPDA